ncbi:MAG TPA: alanine racemase [Candidatus Methylacidiphilales bacterium]|nr:alanine racemase [Candidatus Methylacidiphilales bacterium]
MCPSPIPSRCWAEIDGKALRHNIRVLRAHVAPATQILAPVKANAYGHGIVPIARELARAGVEWLGTASVAEAVQLREAGITIPILMLGAALREEMDAAVHMGIHLTLSSAREARWLNDAVEHAGLDSQTTGNAHLKIDTGMGRLGIWHQDMLLELKQISQLPHVRIAGLMTHFASSDTDPELTRRQWTNFQRHLADAVSEVNSSRRTSKGQRDEPPLLVHAANSGAIVNAIGTSLDLIRPGIVMYGAYGDTPWEGGDIPEPAKVSHWAATELHRVLTWKSRVTLLRNVPAGRTLSYGATYTLPEAQHIATVSAGYGDGYHRLASNRAEVLIRGIRCPIRGRVTMDQILVDVSAVKDVAEGDEVVLVGRQGNAEISACEVASWAQTISYEVLTSISPRVPRVYIDFDSLSPDTEHVWNNCNAEFVVSRNGTASQINNRVQQEGRPGEHANGNSHIAIRRHTA